MDHRLDGGPETVEARAILRAHRRARYSAQDRLCQRAVEGSLEDAVAAEPRLSGDPLAQLEPKYSHLNRV